MRRFVIGLGVLAALAATLAAPSVAVAHPLGNFTINHFSRVVVDGAAVRVHHVIDMAEIPTVSERQGMDADDDGAVSTAEADAYLVEAIPPLVDGLELVVNGARLDLQPSAPARLTFPTGQAGLPTLRIELDLVAAMPPAATRSAAIAGSFDDTADADRVGWREIVVAAGPGARLVRSSVGDASVSDELRSYPANGLDNPMDLRDASFRAEIVDGAPGTAPGNEGQGSAGGSDADPLAGLLAAGNESPLAALVAIAVSLALGAAHAASPGHGKTLMTAYLVGTRGTPSQALALGLTVAATHTAGVFVLGAIVLVASEAFVPERVMEWLGLVAGLIVLGMGIALTARLVRPGRSVEHRHGHDGHGHSHPHDHLHRHGHEHSSERVSSRSVAVIGFAGGLVPSASALIVLLVAVSQGQMVLGIGMVVAFGAGMAIVLGGLGLVVVLARRRFDRGRLGLAGHPLAARIGRAIPAASALAVLAIGIVLALEAVGRIA